MSAKANAKRTNEEIWSDDALGDRRRHADFLQRYLTVSSSERAQRHGAFVVNLDAPWGSGKSFFLSRFSEQLSRDHLVASINAWQDDFASDPLLPVIESIQSTIAPFATSKKARALIQRLGDRGAEMLGAIAVGTAKKFAKRVAGDAVDDVADIFMAGSEKEVAELQTDTAVEEAAKSGLEDGVDKLLSTGKRELSEFAQTRKLVRQFSEALGEVVVGLAKGKKFRAPFFVLIDELDRCRPDYAVRLLERVKHIFGVHGVVFVISTDTKQLAASVKALYGAEFASHNYLQRFFDNTYRLPPGSPLPLVEQLLSHHVISDETIEGLLPVENAQLILDLASAFGATARDLERLLSMLASSVRARNFKSKILLPYFVPLAMAHIYRDQVLINALTKIPAPATAVKEHLLSVGITLPTYTHHDLFERKQIKISCLEILAQLISMLNKGVNNISVPDNDTPEAWAANVLANEHQVENQGISRGEKISSVLLRYNDLISSAGNLT